MTLEGFIPEIWSNEVVRQLEKALVAAQPLVCNRDYEGQIRGGGDTVRITGIGPVSVVNYTKNTDMTDPETLTDAQASLVIDQQKAFKFQIDDVDQAQQQPKVMAGAMAESAYAIRDAIDQFILEKHTEASANNAVGSTASPKVPNVTAGDAQNIYNLVVDCRLALDDSKVPNQGRFMIVPPWVYALLLKEDRFVSAEKAGTTAGLRNGEVGSISGFTILESHNITEHSTYYPCLFGTNKAITFAQQLTKIESYRMEKRFADAVKGLYVYGAKVARPDCLGVFYCHQT